MSTKILYFYHTSLQNNSKYYFYFISQYFLLKAGSYRATFLNPSYIKEMIGILVLIS